MSFVAGWQFILWLMRSRHHVGEFILMCHQDDRLTRVLQAERDRSNVTHVNWWQGSSLKPAETRHRHHIAGWGIAATVLVMLPMIFFLARMTAETPDGTIATAANESEIRRLEDGSMVSVDSGSTLRVEFTEKRRNVHLFQGRAVFDVARGMKSPFAVRTFLVDITTMDSKFSVKIDTSVEVEVYDGVVEVSGRGAKAGAPVITVKKGETYRVPVDGFRAVTVAHRLQRCQRQTPCRHLA